MRRNIDLKQILSDVIAEGLIVFVAVFALVYFAWGRIKSRWKRKQSDSTRPLTGAD